MKKIFLGLCVFLLVLSFSGTASALYYEAFTGHQGMSEWSRDYWFEFDIDTIGPGTTNSNLELTSDATGFEWWNDEQLDSVQLAIDFFSEDSEPEYARIEVDIYWSDADFRQSVYFNASEDNGTLYTYTYDFTQSQIDGWEEGGFGSVEVDARGLSGLGNFVDFDLQRVAMSASPVPEPGTIVLMGLGLVGLAGMGRKKLFKK